MSRAVCLLMLLAVEIGCRQGIGQDAEAYCSEEAPLLTELHVGSLENGGACFRLELEAGEALRLEIAQLGADLSITLGDPSGENLFTFDTPVGTEAPERPCFVTSQAGRHFLHLKSLGAPDAQYSLRQLVRRPATSEDLACAEAGRRFVETADRISKEGISEDLAQSLEAAAGLWGQAGERLSESMARREAAWALESLGQFHRAEGQLHRALEAAKEAKSSYLELSVYNWLGRILLARAQIEPAAGAFRQALTGARAAGDRRAEASALNNLALIDEIEGSIPRATERLREAAKIQGELPFPGDLARTLENLATNLALQDYHQEALDQLRKALELAQLSGSIDVEAHCNLDIGWVHRLQGKLEEALARINEALRLWRSAGDLPGQATALDRLGTVLAESGDRPAALAAFQSSLEISRAIDSPIMETPTLANLACLHQELGNLETSRHLLRQLRRSTWHLLDSKARAHVHYCAAKLEERTGDLPAALEQIEAALEIVEGMRGLSRQQGARHRPIWLWQDYAEYRVHLLVTLSEATAEKELLARAFSAADFARARSLFEMVLESRLPTSDIDVEEQRLQRRLQLLGESRRQLLATAGPDAELQALEIEVSEVILELEATDTRRRASKTKKPSLASPAQISLAQTQALLRPGTLLLRYFLTPNVSFLFVVGPEFLKVHRLPGRRIVEAQAETLHRALLDSAHNPYQADLQSQSTSQVLVPDGVFGADTESLLIVADGALHYVPFAALSISAAMGRPSDPSLRLIDLFEVRFLPSVGVGLALNQRAGSRPQAPKSIAVIADSVFSSTDERLGQAIAGLTGGVQADHKQPTMRQPRAHLPRLEATAAEAASILQWFSSDDSYVALGFDASKESLLDPSMEQYRIVHLATHAFVDERFPKLSGLIFSRYREDGEAVTGELYLHEILGMNLNAELAVLSGCQTALGRRVRGDGLLGLTRGFFHAGSSQVLVSLWSVDDEATAALMAEFYRALSAEGQNAAAALRTAQQWMRSQKRWRQPYFWAPFVLQGVDPSP